MQCLRIKLCLDSCNLQKCFNLRCKCKTITAVEIVERLDTEMVASHEKNRAARSHVTDCESEHSVESLHAVRTFLLIEVQDHFSICMGDEAMTLRFQFGAKLAEVVDFPVIGDPD